MPERDDQQLLNEFTGANSEAAFDVLVSRHVNLVYSTALRFAGNPQAAEEISQAVFIILARKAAGLGRDVVLSGWLYQTARLTAANYVKHEIRRQRREQEAYMQSTLNEPEASAWEDIAPLLDDAMGGLSETDRNAVVLRFFENKTSREVATALKTTEAAAHMRVRRALEKLRRFFTRRGIVSTTAIIAGAVSAHSVQAAPAGLAQTVSAIALAKGVAASTTTLTLVKGALKIMAWTKTQTTIAVAVGVLLATATTTVVIRQNEARQAWDVWPKDFSAFDATLTHTPPQVRIVPTRFPNHGDSYGGAGGKLLGFDVSIADMAKVACASPSEYNWDSVRTIVSPDVPPGRYDFIANLRNDSWLALQKEMERKLGVVGKRETRNEDVLLLAVKNPHAPGLKPGEQRERSYSKNLPNGETFINYGMPDLAVSLERALNVPVVDGTGLKGKFDFDILYIQQKRKSPDILKQSILDNLGLELVPTNLPIDVLVVERTGE